MRLITDASGPMDLFSVVLVYVFVMYSRVEVSSPGLAAGPGWRGWAGAGADEIESDGPGEVGQGSR